MCVFGAVEFGSVVLYDDAVVELLALDLVELLRLDDVLEAALVPRRLQLLQKVQLMRLQLLYALVQRRHRRKHLIMSLFIVSDFFLGLLDASHHVLDARLGVLDVRRRIVQMILHVRPGCDRLKRQTLLAFELSPEVKAFFLEEIGAFQGLSHFLNGFVSLLAALVAEHGLGPEHRG